MLQNRSFVLYSMTKISNLHERSAHPDDECIPCHRWRVSHTFDRNRHSYTLFHAEFPCKSFNYLALQFGKEHSHTERRTYVGSLVICFFTSPTSKLSIDCFNAGAMVGFNVISAVSNGGRFIALGLTGSGILTGSSSSSIICGAGFSGSIGLTFECFDSWQPFIFKNSVKSTLFLLQQDQPLYASWKNGTPGWWRHASAKTNKSTQTFEKSRKF